MALKDILLAQQRLAILRFLSEMPGYDLNDSTLQDSLEFIGIGISRDALRTQLAWLEEQSCITVKNLQSIITVATLTARGLDVAQGAAQVPGIKRPRPGE